MRKDTVLERIIRIEMKLDNHLHTHDTVLKWILCPSLVGVILIIVKLYFLK